MDYDQDDDDDDDGQLDYEDDQDAEREVRSLSLRCAPEENGDEEGGIKFWRPTHHSTDE